MKIITITPAAFLTLVRFILCLLILECLLPSRAAAQVPNKFNYQAVARNSIGQAIPNATINVRISILDGGTTAPTVYTETRLLITNQIGLFTLAIGSPGATQTSGNFLAINWATGNKFIKVEADPLGGSNFTLLGNTELLSVPYALYAVNGKRGDKGDKGDKGDTGPQGLQGAQGNAGPTGQQGAQGPQGNAGPQGITGPQGSQGTPGLDTQKLTISGNLLSISGGNTVSLPAHDAFGTAGGDLSGTYPNPGVAKIQGKPVSNAVPANGQVLKYNITAGQWEPGIDNEGTGGGTGDGWGTQTVVTNPAELSGNGTIANPLRLKPAVSTGQVLKWDGANWSPGTDNTGGSGGTNYSAGTGISISGSNVISNNVDSLVKLGDVKINNPTAAQVLQYDAATKKWVNGSGATLTGWATTGNAATDSLTHFIGTTDSKPLMFRVNNNYAGRIGSTGSIALGRGALRSSVGGTEVAIGDSALYHNGEGANLDYEESLYNTAAGSKALYSNTHGSHLSAFGTGALYNNTIGFSNSAFGSQALYSNTGGSYNTVNGNFALYSNATGSHNTVNGNSALYSNTIGNYNTANGSSALYNNTTGNYNTANGYIALARNITGDDNSAFGDYALNSNTAGSRNTAVGDQALLQNETGNSNVAVGIKALYGNIVGSNLIAIGDSALYNNGDGAVENTAVGSKALHKNTAGNRNTANGFQSLYNNTSGYSNTANGVEALWSNTTGTFNTAAGLVALYANTTGRDNTAFGDFSLVNNTSGSDNTAIGDVAGLSLPSTVNNVTCIGSGSGVSTASSNEIYLGNTSVTKIIANVTGITAYSDGRIKDDVKENVAGINFITALRPVTYRLNIKKEEALANPPELTPRQAVGKKEDHNKTDYPEKYDIEKIVQTGFIAQEVEAAAKKAGYNFSGVHAPVNGRGLYSLNYTEFVVPLVKAVQEQQTIIETQSGKLNNLQQQITELKNLLLRQLPANVAVK